MIHQRQCSQRLKIKSHVYSIHSKRKNLDCLYPYCGASVNHWPLHTNGDQQIIINPSNILLMGMYINEINGKQVPATGKARFIKDNVEGVEIIGSTPPAEFTDNLVCVVANFFFEAAGYCFDKREMEDFAYNDGRKKLWLIVPDAEKYAQ